MHDGPACFGQMKVDYSQDESNNVKRGIVLSSMECICPLLPVGQELFTTSYPTLGHAKTAIIRYFHSNFESPIVHFQTDTPDQWHGPVLGLENPSPKRILPTRNPKRSYLFLRTIDGIFIAVAISRPNSDSGWMVPGFDRRRMSYPKDWECLKGPGYAQNSDTLDAIALVPVGMTQAEYNAWVDAKAEPTERQDKEPKTKPKQKRKQLSRISFADRMTRIADVDDNCDVYITKDPSSTSSNQEMSGAKDVPEKKVDRFPPCCLGCCVKETDVGILRLVCQCGDGIGYCHHCVRQLYTTRPGKDSILELPSEVDYKRILEREEHGITCPCCKTPNITQYRYVGYPDQTPVTISDLPVGFVFKRPFTNLLELEAYEQLFDDEVRPHHDEYFNINEKLNRLIEDINELKINDKDDHGSNLKQNLPQLHQEMVKTKRKLQRKKKQFPAWAMDINVPLPPVPTPRKKQKNGLRLDGKRADRPIEIDFDDVSNGRPSVPHSRPLQPRAWSDYMTMQLFEDDMSTDCDSGDSDYIEDTD